METADAIAESGLAAQGLRYGLVDTDDDMAFGDWLEMCRRGFHLPALSEPHRAAQLAGLAHRRTTGV